jgi:ABC-type glycerol-3-phosphate transport system substrate-binding protein
MRTLLSTLLVLAVAGCVEPAPTPTPTSTLSASVSTSPSPLPTATSTPPGPQQPAIVTLQFWLPEQMSPYGEELGADLLAQRLTDFSKTYLDLQVEVTVTKAHGRGGLLDFMDTAQEAAPSVLPDLVVLDAAELETAAGLGLLQPLDALLPSAEMTDRFPFAAELGTVGEQTFGFVVGADMQHVAYRPALYDSPPISWTRVISPPVPFLLPAAGQDRQINDATLIQYLADGGKLTDSDDDPSLDEDVMVSVLGFYSGCVGSSTISPTVVLDIASADQAWERFLAGEGGMTVVWASRYWPQVSDPSAEPLAVASVPTRDGRPFSVARGWVIAMVTDDPARQTLAMLLLGWLIAPEHSAQWTQASGYLPGARSALRLWDVSDAERAVLRGIMEAAVAAPRSQVLGAVGPAMQDALEAVLTGRAIPKEAAATAVRHVGE